MLTALSQALLFAEAAALAFAARLLFRLKSAGGKQQRSPIDAILLLGAACLRFCGKPLSSKLTRHQHPEKGMCASRGALTEATCAANSEES